MPTPASACPRCGARVDSAAVEGLCPKCLLSAFLAVEPSPAEPGMRVGQHEIVAELGAGGMGVVFRARDPNRNRDVALKLVKGGAFASDEDQRKFREEAKTNAMLDDHPNIVRVLQMGEGTDDKGPFFTMELMGGGPLADDLAWFRADPRRACALVAATARAVHYAHGRGVLHRDLKPANVLLDEQRNPHVADFGTAKQMNDARAMTRTGVVMGTASYMSPEQARGDRNITQAADTWSLGAILYELITVGPPFLATTYEATLQLVRQSEPARPRSLNSDLDKDLETICLKCLEKVPGRRYRSAEALADDLGRYLRGESIEARPIGRAERAWRWSGRHPLIVGAGLALALAATAGLITSVQLEARSRRETLAANSRQARTTASTILLQLQQTAESFEFRRYSDQVQRPAQDPTLIKLLEEHSYEALLVSPLPVGVAMPRGVSTFDTWLVLDESGAARARWPRPPDGYFPKDFSRRDFFVGARELAQAGKRTVHISRAFVDEVDGRARFAFSTPMFGSDGALVGVMLAMVAATSIQPARAGDRDHTTAVFGLRDSEQPADYVFLFHDGLERGSMVSFDARQAALPEKLIGTAAAPTGEQLRLPEPDRVGASDHYLDPVAGYGGRWLAGMAPVGDTGFVVVVQTRYDFLLEPLVQALAPRRATEPAVQRASAAPADILLGEVGSLTGPDAEFGISTRNGIELAINAANARRGVDEAKVSLRVYDDQSRPGGAAEATRRLLTRDHVKLILGEAASSNSLAMAPIAQAAGVPMVTPASTNPAVTQAGDYVFRACFSDLFQGLVMARYAHDTLKVQQVAVLVESESAYSEGLGEEFERRFKEAGGEIVVTGKYRKGDTDFRGQLAAIAKSGATAIYLPGYVAEVVLIAQQARQLGIHATLLGGDGWDSEKLFETGGEWINGSYVTDHYSTDDPAVEDFVRQYKDAFGSVPDARAALGYDAARMAMDAIRRAPDVSGPALRDALARTRNFSGVTGTITVDEQRNAVKPAVVLEVQDGRFKYLQTVKP